MLMCGVSGLPYSSETSLAVLWTAPEPPFSCVEVCGLHQAKRVCLHSSSSRPHVVEWDFFCGPVSGPSRWQRLVTFLPLVSPSVFHKAPLSHHGWVVKGRTLLLGFQVGDSFGVWTGLQGDLKAIKHHETLLLMVCFSSEFSSGELKAFYELASVCSIS